jgi:hypothetical protein
MGKLLLLRCRLDDDVLLLGLALEVEVYLLVCLHESGGPVVGIEPRGQKDERDEPQDDGQVSVEPRLRGVQWTPLSGAGPWNRCRASRVRLLR